MNKEYYVYAWFCKDWGHIPFYVGKGKGNRYKSKNGRNIQFSAIIKHFQCYPLLLGIELTEEAALWIEQQVKLRFAQSGFPIIDMENGELRKMFQKEGIALNRAKNLPYGRRKIEIPDFEKFLKKQKDGLITVNEAISQLNISRATWYNLAKEVS